jgi:hypothetical protein
MSKTSPSPIFSQLVLSSADSLSGFLQAGSSPIVFGPVGLASGEAPPAFDQTKKIGSFAHSYDEGTTVVGPMGGTTQRCRSMPPIWLTPRARPGWR